MRTRLLLIAIAIAVAAPAAHAGISPEEARQWHPDTDAAERYAKSRSTDVSFAIFDMRNRLSAHEGSRSYIMASTFKVMLLAAYLRQDSVDDRALTEGERNILGPMIRESDNSNATQVRDMLGRGPIESLAGAAGMDGFQWNGIWGYSRAEPKDGARLMRRLPGLLPNRHRGVRPGPPREHHRSPALGRRPRQAGGLGRSRSRAGGGFAASTSSTRWRFFGTAGEASASPSSPREIRPARTDARRSRACISASSRTSRSEAGLRAHRDLPGAPRRAAFLRRSGRTRHHPRRGKELEPGRAPGQASTRGLAPATSRSRSSTCAEGSASSAATATLTWRAPTR